MKTRENKFGAWYKNKMHEVFSLHSSGMVTIPLMRFPFTQDVMPDAVVQYTGLKDKNGKKIFEGDIIKYHDYYEAFGKVKENTWRTGKIVWDNKRLCFQAEHDKGYGPYKMNFYHQTNIEVIGNIYENPELIH